MKLVNLELCTRALYEDTSAGVILSHTLRLKADIRQDTPGTKFSNDHFLCGVTQAVY